MPYANYFLKVLSYQRLILLMPYFQTVYMFSSNNEIFLGLFKDESAIIVIIFLSNTISLIASNFENYNC